MGGAPFRMRVVRLPWEGHILCGAHGAAAQRKPAVPGRNKMRPVVIATRKWRQPMREYGSDRSTFPSGTLAPQKKRWPRGAAGARRRSPRRAGRALEVPCEEETGTPLGSPRKISSVRACLAPPMMMISGEHIRKEESDWPLVFSSVFLSRKWTSIIWGLYLI